MVLGNTGRGGAQTFAVNVLRSIDRERFQIDFVVNAVLENGYTDEIRKLGSAIYTIPYYKVYNHGKYKKAFIDVLQSKKYDIVHGNVSSSAVVYLKIAKKFGCATIVHSHSAGYRGNGIEVFIKKIYTVGAKRYANYWFACSDKAAIRLFGKKYMQYDKYYCVPNAIQACRFKYDPLISKKIRASIGVSDDTPLFGHIGSFTAPKNHEFLLDVFHEIHNKEPMSKLVLIGDGELRTKIEAKIIDYRLQDSIVMTGNIANANEYMMAIDEMIFPSLFEGFPISVLEAEATGTCIILSDTITKEVYLTDSVHPVSLNLSVLEWANISLENLNKEIDRLECNRIISETKYNIDNSVGLLSVLYEEMANNQSALQ